MSLFSILGKGLKAMYQEATTPESFKTGEKFEDYVRNELFIDKYYDLIERTHNYDTNKKDFVEATLKPDFKFRDRLTKKEFYVEAKFRASAYNGKIIWCSDSQMQRYRNYHRNTPVFVILGMGENPKDPGFLALMSLPNAKYTGLFPSYVKGFEIKTLKPIASKTLWSK
ncbi:MAG: hypothetical protein Q8M29_04965 [Bacteroidota bacterium]|nr:hypothetical protein [Bacteroidota bacterium]